ncbi:serine/threonine-protein kinase [Actinacidiphila sp. ITFR-21]|uniref:serine/threonine-protein kinase n=1 Tax=Actinacidiphila sp. ITFR-21 TaxID=3075199 RepID=UPI00288A6262|nr:serine/threonine-protein kinase [Streptomyces sp. ITFR-21]WNI14109.1 serine/threonine-protein kinase [Streptomyces sp. ITFR-21]
MRLAERYRLDAPLGHGGMGQVWRGWDELLERPVAVKLLHDSAARDPESSARFAHEARTAARLSDPHVAAVYDFGSWQGRCFLVMELIDGHTLADELKARGPAAPALAASVAAQAAAGLAAAHARGVVHRDVKPSNLLIDRDGTVTIVDFGIASGPGGETTAPMDAPGKVSGTSLYLAPESALGRPARAAGDVYALGCALYELLTGRPPFIGDSPLAVICQHVERAALAPDRLRPGIPDAFAGFVLEMLAKDPERRPTARHAAEWFAGGSWHAGSAVPDPVAEPLPVPETGRRSARRPLLGRRRRALIKAAAGSLLTAHAEPGPQGI